MRSFALMLMMLPLPAAAFTARNGMQAAQISPTEIAVEFDSARADTDYWCAAGDFAKRVLGQPAGTRFWRASAKPRGAGEGITFTLDAARKAEGAGLSQFGAGVRDGGMSVGSAVALHCRMEIPFWKD